jgi:predicted oxidoreductase (fatty acid repression mutant protein)
MSRSFKEALQHRRSYYALGSERLVNKGDIEEMVEFALMHVPSAFNSQSSRVVMLIEKAHRRFWQIVKDTLQAQIPADVYIKTEKKINQSFASGYGTLLFFEDRSVVQMMEQKFPLYAPNFFQWSQQTSAMHQLVLWCMLEDRGLGASLQHYNPLVDESVRQEWGLPSTWELVAQMPFGYPLTMPSVKSHEPVLERMRVFE